MPTLRQSPRTVDAVVLLPQAAGAVMTYPFTVIGLTGRRGVGKSEIAKDLVETMGAFSAHTFAGGKAATEAYFRHIGCSIEEAHRMVHGDLRDLPHVRLPGGRTPRYFMEHFGRFMGQEMGAQWTLGTELRRLADQGVTGLVVIESVVYEADIIRSAGGRIIRVVRPNSDGPMGIATDRAQAAIKADTVIVNRGTLEELKQTARSVVQQMVGGG